MVHIRVDKAERDECEKILSGLGTNFSALVNMLMKQVILTKSIPFTVAYPEPVKEDEKQEAKEKEEPINEETGTLAEDNVKLGDDVIDFIKKYAPDSDLLNGTTEEPAHLEESVSDTKEQTPAMDDFSEIFAFGDSAL